MNIKLNYSQAKTLSDDQILKTLKGLYPHLSLYSVSTGWRESKEYILKARGSDGDMIVSWM